MSISSNAPVGLAHLTLLDVPPPELVRTAAEAGYDAVGIRIHPVHPSEEGWPMLGDTPMLKATREALQETGLQVWDFETIRVGPEFSVDDYLLMFEIGASLGGSYVNVFPADFERHRLLDSLAKIADVAAQFGVLPLVEPMVYNGIPSMTEGIDVLSELGGKKLALTLDALHFHRYGGTTEQIAALPAGSVAMFQICDGPLTPPTQIDAPPSLPRNQSTDAPPIALEGRAFRLLPGDGELPLADYVAALAPEVLISVEAPCYPKQQQLTPLQIARESLANTRRILAAADQ
ncbi:sugar phosphate isomerase/epimerase family protein [Paenarthrobacter nicotinovorans]|uniref:sugar phosphate isomerase/epimerase family protein n=1 Tax=Paenarthrobacter nicotinovorans TaxID=29320 RepID=UPI0038194DC0